MRRLKRKSSEVLCMTHQEVFCLVRERKIHEAEELYDLAREISRGGDDKLLNYCSGGNGEKKKGLQKIIDSVWELDSGAASAEELDARHRRPLGEQALLELQRRARRPQPKDTEKTVLEVLDSCTGGLTAIADAGLRRRGTQSRISRFSEPSKDSAMLFDHFDRQAEILFRPRSGLWRLRDFFELLVACRQQLNMAKTEPSPALEGGLRLPRSEAGWQAMLKAGVAQPAAAFAMLSEEEKASSAAELRLGSGCGVMPWRSSSVDFDSSSWIVEMPQEPAFEHDTFDNRPSEEKVVRLWAKDHIEDKQLMAVLNSLEACQHTVVETKGFFIKNNSMRVTGTKERSSKHLMGPVSSMTCAHLALEDEKEGVSRQKQGKARRMYLLGDARVADKRPDLTAPRLASVRALCDKPKS